MIPVLETGRTMGVGGGNQMMSWEGVIVNMKESWVWGLVMVVDNSAFIAHSMHFPRMSGTF